VKPAALPTVASGLSPVRRTDCQGRSERARELGRIAYRLAKDGDLVGVVTREGREKYIRKRDEGWLSVELVTPHPRSTNPTDFSELEVRASGRKVLEIRWDNTGSFKVVI
jgi:hypothetical protein